MARASQTTQTPTGYKLAPTLTEPTVDGDVVDTGDVHIMVTNGTAGSIDVTVTAVATVEGLAVEDLVVAVAAGQTALIGPLPKTVFGQTTGDDKTRAYVDYSAQTDVDRAVVKL